MQRIKKEFIILGATMSVYDQALFFWYDEIDELIGVLTLHVDDFAFVGSTDFLENTVRKVKSVLKISSENQGMFKYIELMRQFPSHPD